MSDGTKVPIDPGAAKSVPTSLQPASRDLADDTQDNAVSIAHRWDEFAPLQMREAEDIPVPLQFTNYR